MKSSSQTPNHTHANAATICEMAFKAMGLRAKRAVDYRDGYDFDVEGKVRVACRFAMPTSDRQQLYKKRNGEVSTYHYKRWTFNFHRHGRITDRYCDFFVCFLASPAVAADASEVVVFVIPWEAITGLTFCSSVREGSVRGYRGKYVVYQDAWHLIEKGARGQKATSTKVLRISSDSRQRLKLVIGGDKPRTDVLPLANALRPKAAAPTSASKGGDKTAGKAAAKKGGAQVLRLRVE